MSRLETAAPAAGEERLARLALVLLFLWVLLRTAWVGDDAYITFRSVQNLISGLGPTYNVGERVQAFTHPLWMLLQSGVHAAVSRGLGVVAPAQLYYQVLAISAACATSAVALLLLRIAPSLPGAVLGGAAAVLSKAFVEYSTSGLETPASYLLVCAFAWLYLGHPAPAPRRLAALSVIAALAALNRPDLLLLLLPALAVAWWRGPGRLRRAGAVAVGTAPLALWELFSLVYYGFAVPNTAWTKLATGITPGDLRHQGWIYLLDSLESDPLTLLVIAGALLAVPLRRRWELLPLAAGILVYLGYVVSIGGDFMSGRMLSVPFLLALCLLCSGELRGRGPQAVLLAVVLAVGAATPQPPLLTDSSFGPPDPADRYSAIRESGIADERAFYFPTLGLLNDRRDGPVVGTDHPGPLWAERPERLPERVTFTGPVGQHGFIVGPAEHMVDLYALVDPLRARLPVADPETWRIGHFEHLMPAGYLDSLRAGENRIEDPVLAEYYDRLTTVVRGEIWSLRRFGEIWRFLTGANRHLVDEWVAGVRRRQQERKREEEQRAEREAAAAEGSEREAGETAEAATEEEANGRTTSATPGEGR